MDDSVYFEILTQQPDFLPMTMDEMRALGRETVDFVLVTGDAYVDHPSFGAAIIGKFLWAQGFSVGIAAQPDINKSSDFRIFGTPRLGFLVTSGNVDSMVNNYTSAKKRRKRDQYSPGGLAGLRPDRALTAYCRKIRDIYGKKIPIIIGGIEASLRRLAHYDYWSDSIRKSVLIDSCADILVYGMGERAIAQIAAYLNQGAQIEHLRHIRGIVYKVNAPSIDVNYISLPDFNNLANNPRSFAESFKIQLDNTEHTNGKTLLEKYGNDYIVQNPPAKPLSAAEMDVVYNLNFAREPHPSYKKPIPSISEVKFSITASRGCFGGCNFCALSYHQGRTISSRSHDSIISETKKFINFSDFKGYIHDVGGPTANFYGQSCQQMESGACTRRKCLAPKPCKNLKADHSDYLDLLRKLRALPGIKKAFIRSGIRFDFLLLDKNQAFFREMCEFHISGQLKIAPEHVCAATLAAMGKPSAEIYEKFTKQYYEINSKIGKKQFLVPYLMSSHPGSTLSDAVELACYLHKNRISPEQVQDFYPTPGTPSTCMYFTELDLFTMKKIYVAKTAKEKAMHRALIQYRLPQNYDLVHEALQRAGRRDLIGFGKNCLLRPKGR